MNIDELMTAYAVKAAEPRPAVAVGAAPVSATVAVPAGRHRADVEPSGPSVRTHWVTPRHRAALPAAG